MKEAKAFVQSGALTKTQSGPSAASLSVYDAVDRWLKICVEEGTENHEPVTHYTGKTYAHRAEIMKSYEWTKPVQLITPVDIQDFKSWLLENCVGRHQAMKVLSSFHTVMHEMMIRGVVGTNPVSGISIKMDSRYKKQIVPPTEREVLALLSAADRLANSPNPQLARYWERFRPILYLSVDTGARPQEYLAASRENLSDSNALLIDRAIEKGGHKISATKTKAGCRTLDISADVADMVRHYADHHGITSTYGLMFPTSTGRWMQVEHWRNRGFYKACKEAGLMVQVEQDGKRVDKPKFTPYDIRHFYASMLIEQRTNLKRLKKLLGHESITTTLNTYGHLIERVEAKAEDRSGLVSDLGHRTCGEVVASTL